MSTFFSPVQTARHQRAFTLVELLVATVVLLIILLMLVAMVNSTSTIWRTTATKVEQFRSARTAFESINRHLSQATLNTYFDYQLDATTNKPLKYVRQSDLRIVAGATNQLVPTPTGDKPPMSEYAPGHAIFFHGPMGFASTDDQTIDPSTNAYMYTPMDNLLNVWGYFVEYSSDYNYRPQFLNTASTNYRPPPERHRYRLMEMMVPSDQIITYRYTSKKDNFTYFKRDWFDSFLKLPATQSTTTQDTSTTQLRPAHLLAENVVMLVVYPQLAAKDQATVLSEGGKLLAPGYTYDSAQQDAAANPRTDPRAQLPPVVQVTMIAMDEASALRQEATKGNSGGASEKPPDRLNNILTQKSYFTSAVIDHPQSDPNASDSASKYPQDLKNIQKDLVDQRITFRTFTTSVSLRAAKWSQD